MIQPLASIFMMSMLASRRRGPVSLLYRSTVLYCTRDVLRLPTAAAKLCCRIHLACSRSTVVCRQLCFSDRSPWLPLTEFTSDHAVRGRSVYHQTADAVQYFNLSSLTVLLQSAFLSLQGDGLHFDGRTARHRIVRLVVTSLWQFIAVCFMQNLTPIAGFLLQKS